MKPCVGDVIEWQWAYNAYISGVVLRLEDGPGEPVAGIPVPLKYRMEILEADGGTAWYDVWDADEPPTVVIPR